MTNIHDLIVAQVEQELADFEAADAAAAAALAKRGRRAGGSVVYSVRLDPGEVEALEQRAVAAGIKPSVLARNLIRMGLATPTGAALRDVFDRLDQAVTDLRALAVSRQPMGGGVDSLIG